MYSADYIVKYSSRLGEYVELKFSSEDFSEANALSSEY